MNGTEQVSGAWNERMRLIRLRRKKEKSRFVDEFRLVPRWLIALVVVVFVVAQVVAVFVNLSLLATGGETWAPELRNNPVASTAGLMGIITLGSAFMAAYIFLIAYVNRDANRCGIPARNAETQWGRGSTSARIANATCIPPARSASVKSLNPTSFAPTAAMT